MGKVKSLPDRKTIRKTRETITVGSFPHQIDLLINTTVRDGKREEIREWFKARGLLTYPHWGEVAHVKWDKNWRKFFFKNKEYAVEFALRFG